MTHIPSEPFPRTDKRAVGCVFLELILPTAWSSQGKHSQLPVYVFMEKAQMECMSSKLR